MPILKVSAPWHVVKGTRGRNETGVPSDGGVNELKLFF